MAERKKSLKTKPQQPEPASHSFDLKWWMIATAFVVLLFVYGSPLQGPILFDDLHLPVFGAAGPPSWASYCTGVRPLYYLSLQVNYALSGREPFSYHLLNIILHFVNAFLIYYILKKLLELTGSPEPESFRLSLVGAGVFAFHPLQSEAVAYISSRSENLSALFAYTALALFVGTVRNTLGWRRSLAILVLLTAGVLTKEPVAAMAGVILIVDWWANGRRFSRALADRWRLHGPLLLGVIVAVPALIIFVSKHSGGSAGFTNRSYSWYLYLATQFKVVWVYVRLFVMPVGQSIDYQMSTVVSVFDPLVLLGLAALLVSLYLAWKAREKYPLFLLGALIFLILLTPTSSVIPINDVIAERRAYLPSLGLLLIVLEFVRHSRVSFQKSVVPWCVIALLAIGCWHRNKAFTSEVALWEEATNSCPWNTRAWVHLGTAYVMAGRCADAAAPFARAEALGRHDEILYLNMATARVCEHEYDRAVNAFRAALSISPKATTWAYLAEAYGNQGRWPEAQEALEAAFRLDQNSALAYRVAGELFLKLNQVDQAAAAYQKALTIMPGDGLSQVGLAEAERIMLARRQAAGKIQR